MTSAFDYILTISDETEGAGEVKVYPLEQRIFSTLCEGSVSCIFCPLVSALTSTLLCNTC